MGVIGGKGISSEQLKELYVKPYIEAFPDTLLVLPWGSHSFDDTYEWAATQGVTIRRDGIFKYSDGSECLIAYGKLPTIYEYTYDYNTLKAYDLWNTEYLLEYVNIGKPHTLKYFQKCIEKMRNFAICLLIKWGTTLDLMKHSLPTL